MNKMAEQLRQHARSACNMELDVTALICNDAADEIDRLTNHVREHGDALMDTTQEVARLAAERDEWRQKFWDADRARLEACDRWYDAEKARIASIPSGTAPLVNDEGSAEAGLPGPREGETILEWHERQGSHVVGGCPICSPDSATD